MVVWKWWQETRLNNPLSAFLFISLLLHAVLLSGLGAIRLPKRHGAVAGTKLNVSLPEKAMVVPAFDMPTFTSQAFLQSIPAVIEPLLSDTGAAAPPDDFAAQPVVALPIEERYFKSSELDEQPRPVNEIRPDYPAHAFAQGLEGWVRLLLLIDEQGNVRHLEVMDASPARTFDESALTAFRLAHFVPGKRGGEAVKSRMILKVDFDLDRLSASD